MEVRLQPCEIPDVVIVEHQFFSDDRGFFKEVFRKDVFEEVGLPTNFVQLSHSRSSGGVVRGLHFQWSPPMGKLMRVTQGAAFLAAVDIRKGSPTMGKWVGRELTAESMQQMWAPAGFARGFCALTDGVEIEYLCTGTYSGAGESGILWNDPAIGIEWPIENPVLSARDASARTLAQWLVRPESRNFQYDIY